MPTVQDVRELFELSLKDEQITPHLNRAINDYKEYQNIDPFDLKEAICSKTLYYLAPLIWNQTSTQAREYDETLQTYGDLTKFQNYWQNRANTAIAKYNQGAIKWAVI